MKQLCLIFAISIAPSWIFAQFTGDSVIIYVENRVELKVAISDYADLKTSDRVSKAIDEFQNRLPQIESQLSTADAELVTFFVGDSITIEPGNPKIIYLFNEGAISNTGVRDQVIIVGDGFKAFLTTADLLNISDLPLTDCLEKVTAMLPKNTRWSRSLYYECIDGVVQELESKHRNLEFDSIELNLGAGGGLIKNNWVTDISAQVALGVVKKGIRKGRPYLSTNLIFEFGDEGDIDLNMFLNIGYKPYIVQDPAKSTYLGVELGYLIMNQGELFEDTTFKLGVNWSPLKGVVVGPQLYATDNFNKVFPGIRIGFGL